jgi:hypothetical protein
MGEWRAHQLVFVDESGVNPRTGERTWRDKGHVVKKKVPGPTEAGPRRENYSVFPAMTIDGYIACKIHRGVSVNGETFKSFIIDDLLPLCNPWPGSNSVIVMDNAIPNVFVFEII